MAFVKYGQLEKRLKKHVRASVKPAKLAKYAYAFVVDSACRAVLLYDRCEYEVVHCEPEFFGPMVRVIDGLPAALGNCYFIVRPAKSEVRCLFAPGFYSATEPTGDLMACEGVEGKFFLRGLPQGGLAARPRGFFGGPPVPVEAGIRLLWDRDAPATQSQVGRSAAVTAHAWRATMLHASRDKATGDVTVAFDPPRHSRKRQRLALRAVVRWCGDRESTDDRSLMLRPVHAAAWGGEVLSTDDRALLRAVGVIEVRRQVAARVIGRVWRRAVACPEYKVRLAASGAPCAPRVPGQAEQGVRGDDGCVSGGGASSVAVWRCEAAVRTIQVLRGSAIRCLGFRDRWDRCARRWGGESSCGTGCGRCGGMGCVCRWGLRAA